MTSITQVYSWYKNYRPAPEEQILIDQYAVKVAQWSAVGALIGGAIGYGMVSLGASPRRHAPVSLAGCSICIQQH